MSLVAHWKLNGTLLNENGNNHLVSQFPSFVDDEVFGKVLELPGTGLGACESMVPLNQSIVGLTDYSVTFRIWVDPTIVQPTRSVVLSLYDDSNGGGGDYLVGINFRLQKNQLGRLILESNVKSSLINDEEAGWTDTGIDLTDGGNWHTITSVVKYSSAGYMSSLYFDGLFQGNSPVQTGNIPIIDDATLKVGYRVFGDTTADFAKVRICDIRIHNEAVDEAEILRMTDLNYGSETLGSLSRGLIVYYDVAKTKKMASVRFLNNEYNGTIVRYNLAGDIVYRSPIDRGEFNELTQLYTSGTSASRTEILFDSDKITELNVNGVIYNYNITIDELDSESLILSTRAGEVKYEFGRGSDFRFHFFRSHLSGNTTTELNMNNSGNYDGKQFQKLNLHSSMTYLYENNILIQNVEVSSAVFGRNVTIDKDMIASI